MHCKKWFMSCLALIVALSFVGCNQGGGENVTASASVSEMAEAIKENIEVSLMEDTLENFISMFEGLDADMIEESTFNIPMMIQSNEVDIVKVKDSKDVETVKAALEKRLKNVQDSFEHYLPDPYELAKNGKVVVKGNYVMLIIDEDVDKAIEIFEGFFK